MQFGPEVIGHVFGLPIYNTFVTTLATDAILLLIIFSIYKGMKFVPGKLQNIFEQMIEYFYVLTQEVAGKNADAIFPWFATFFIFIFFANILGLLPGFGTIGFYMDHGKEFVPLFRSATSDFNTTLGLSFVSLIATHVIAIRTTGVKEYISRYFSLNPIYLYVGFLEIISEFTKLISLSFRLFGNIFAGEVVLKTVSELTSFTAFIAPIPFLMLESIVALVQALVFAMLTMVFMAILATPHAAEGH